MQSADAITVAETWKNGLEQNGMIVLEHANDEHLVVDAARPWNAFLASEGDSDIVARLDAGRASSRPPVRRCHILYVGPWPPSDAATTAIHAVAQNFGPKQVRLDVYFTDPRPDLVNWLQRFAGETGRCAINFVGTIPELDEDEISVLVARGASVMYAAGWPDGSPVDTTAVRKMSNLGLRIPMIYFVHQGNIDTVIDDAVSMLDMTYHSGVAFVPACSHPLFDSDSQALLPEAGEYAELLVEAYRRFPHYDDVFEPIVSLVERLRSGGWSPEGNHALPVRYRIDASGVIQEFRQLPWQATSSIPDNEFNPSRLATISDECSACRWLKACGGCEKTSASIFRLVCKYQMLFLEFFVRQMHEHLLHSQQEG